MVTQRFERNAEGRFERQIAGSLLLATDAIVERGRGGDTMRVDVGRFDELWARYDDGDYGTGDATRPATRSTSRASRRRFSSSTSIARATPI